MTTTRSSRVYHELADAMSSSLAFAGNAIVDHRDSNSYLDTTLQKSKALVSLDCGNGRESIGFHNLTKDEELDLDREWSGGVQVGVGTIKNDIEVPNIKSLSLSRNSSHSSIISTNIFLTHGLSRSSSASSNQRTYVLLDNNTSEPTNVFAQSITIVDYIRVGEMAPSGYILYNCRAVTADGTVLYTRKRFSDFVTLRKMLKKAFPNSNAIIPKLPPKTIVGKFRPSFLAKRRKSLEYFLSCVLLHPVLGGSNIARKWFSA